MSTSTDVARQGLSDPMTPRRFRVNGKRQDTADTTTLWLSPVDGGPLHFAAGQFTMLGAFGVGEVPISISGHPEEDALLQHTIRDVGGVTHSLVASEPGDVLSVRGPFGHGWGVGDAAAADLVIVAGGIGLAPLRPALLEAVSHRESYGRVVLVYGARTPADLLFLDELQLWRSWADLSVHITVDAADASWSGAVGLVTTPLSRIEIDPQGALALVCGPEVMMRHVATGLRDLGLPGDRIRLSMERIMQCGLGLCGHCQLREHFLCVDGPVLPWSVLEPLMRTREL